METQADNQLDESKAPPSADEVPAANSATTGLRRLGFLVLATFFFTLGTLGILIPGLPATPFLLLCSYFLARSSPRLHGALLRSRLFGGLLRDWRERRAIRRRVKQRAVLIVLVVVGVTLHFSNLTVVFKATIGGLALIGLCVLWKLPTFDLDAGEAVPNSEKTAANHQARP